MALLPTDVNSVLIARLDRLQPSIKAIVQAAAVIGREFDLEVLKLMFDDRRLIAEHVHEAVQQGIFLPLSGDRFRFRHALLRDGAHATLTDHDRRVGHRLAGHWLEERGERAVDQRRADDRAAHAPSTPSTTSGCEG